MWIIRLLAFFLQVPGEDDEVDEETMEELQGLIEADYEVCVCVIEQSG